MLNTAQNINNTMKDINLKIEDIIDIVRGLAPHRSMELFSSFLPKGYQMTTLSSVDESLKVSNLLVKVCIGCLITLYDDLADNPKLRNPLLLSELYQIPFGQKNNVKFIQHPIYLGISELWNIVLSRMLTFPHYQLLWRAFEFDVLQFFNANRYAEIITDAPFLFNSSESRSYLPHNMGIILVGTIDLMCSSIIEINNLGICRIIFFEAQKAARMMNMIVTVDREKNEGDVTNELAFIDENQRKCEIQSMQEEMNSIFKKLNSLKLSTFSVRGYVCGLRELFELHKNLQGVI